MVDQPLRVHTLKQRVEDVAQRLTVQSDRCCREAHRPGVVMLNHAHPRIATAQMCLVGDNECRFGVLAQTVCLGQDHCHTSILDAELLEQRFVLLLQFLPVGQHKDLSPALSYHLGE